MEQSPQKFGLGWGREEASKYQKEMHPTQGTEGGRVDSGGPPLWSRSQDHGLKVRGVLNRPESRGTM